MILVIGYGSPLRGDDGVGYHLALHLAERNHSPDVWVMSCHQLTPELAEPVSRASLTIFIDAHPGEPTGALTVRDLTPTPVTGGAFTHNVSPESLLAAAQTLYDRQPEGILVSIEGQSFEYQDSVSPAMQNAMPMLLEAIEQIIQLECQLKTTEDE